MPDFIGEENWMVGLKVGHVKYKNGLTTWSSVFSFF
jgi:hypothetical protein